MTRYIDADRLKELLDEKHKEFTEKAKKDCPLQCQYMADGLDIAEQFIDSLRQEQTESSKGKFVFPDFLYARTIDNKTIDVSYAPQSMDAVEYIKNDPVEQPEVDWEKELEEYFGEDWKEGTPIEVQDDLIKFAIHFYELRLNTRKKG